MTRHTIMTTIRLLLFLLTMVTSDSWAGGIGDPRLVHICQGGDNAGLECLTNVNCPSSKCILTSFLPVFPRLCLNGPQQNQKCDDTGDCSNNPCVIDFVAPQPTAIRATLTLISDDDETNLEASPVCKSATILLEVKKGAKLYLLPQTYRCVPQGTDPEVEFARTEARLNDAVADASILNRILFREFDGGADDPARSEISQQLRNIFGLMGRPVVTSATKILDHTDNEMNMLGSAVRLRITISFVKE